MTYAGEAVGLDFANVISGSPFADFGDAIRYEDGATSTVTAGDSFLAGFFDFATLVTGETVEFTFAIVCAAGSSGTLRLSGGTDPDYALDDPGDAPVSLGTFDVSGAQTVQSGVLPRDVDDYLTQAEETIVYVECLSGSVVIEQVKLYIHPVGGPVGGWVLAPGFTVSVAPEFRSVGTGIDNLLTAEYVATEPVGPFEDAAAEVVSLWGANLGLTTETGPTITSLSANLAASVAVAVKTLTPTLTYSGTGNLNEGASLAQQPDPDVVTVNNTPTYGEAVDVAFSPYAVPGELGVQLLGTPSTEWGVATITAYGYTGVNIVHASAFYALTPIGDDAIDPANRPAYSLPSAPGNPLPSSPGAPGDLVTMPSARTVLLSLGADFLTSPAAYVGDGSLGTSVSAVAIESLVIDLEPSTVTIPAYRYWSPTAVRVPPLRQRNRDKTRARLRPSRQRSIRSRGYL